MRTHTFRVLAAFAVLLSLAASTSAQAPTNPRFGRWKLKPTTPPAADSKASNIMTYAPFGNGGMSITIDSVNAAGNASQWGYTTLFDNKETPMTGQQTGQTAAVRMLSEKVAEITYRRDGRIVQQLTNVLSPDNNSLGIVYMRPNANGGPDGVSFATYERIK